MTTNIDNLELWNRVSKTDPKNTKKVSFGRSFTAIDPHSQIMAATEQFGPAGQGWGWEVVRVEYTTHNEIAILIGLWHTSNGQKSGMIQQWGQSGLYIDKAEVKKDGDCFKKATTDGITKCLSYLGFNADIFLGKFDDNKYVAEMAAEHDPKIKEFNEWAKQSIIDIESFSKIKNLKDWLMGNKSKVEAGMKSEKTKAIALQVRQKYSMAKKDLTEHETK